MGTTSVDPQALRFAAQRLDEAADLLGMAVRNHLSGLRLPAVDPRTRAAIGQLVEGATRWQREAREHAHAVRTGADRYVDEDSRGAQVLQ